MARKTTGKSGAGDVHVPQGAELYHDMPSVTPRQWGTPDAADDSFGQSGLGGPAAAAHAPSGDARQGSTGQGEFAEDQGRHAQSRHGRGGSDGTRGREGANVSRGTGGRDEATRPDDSIRDDIIDRLTRDHELDASQILVMVEDGLVTMTGEVPEQSMKQRAQDTVEQASGARDIVNRITFDDGSASFGPLGQAVRSGNDQQGSGFSSSSRIPGRD